MKTNLNKLTIPTDGPIGSPGEPLTDNSTSVEENLTAVHAIFRDLDKELIKLIREFKDGAIFGCIAWLTHEPVLRALTACKNVQIIVQKEDFLKPDTGFKDNWKRNLHALYKQIKFSMCRFELQHGVKDLSYCGDPTVEGIRCVGNHNKAKSPAFPRMHNKFLVFCKTEEFVRFEDTGQMGTTYTPVAVWTGSYNISNNATNSFENAIVLKDYTGQSQIIEAYLKEHHQILALSEQLDWETAWCSPEYRIGS